MRIVKLMIPLLCVLFFSSCRKDVVVTKEVPVVHSWSLDSSLFFTNKILLTSIALNDSVLADGDLFYFNLGDELYATHGSQIWRVTMTGHTLSYQELDNDGLETNLITSINKAGKYTFVTTLSGLYYRDTATFNTERK